MTRGHWQAPQSAELELLPRIARAGDSERHVNHERGPDSEAVTMIVGARVNATGTMHIGYRPGFFAFYSPELGEN